MKQEPSQGIKNPQGSNRTSVLFIMQQEAVERNSKAAVTHSGSFAENAVHIAGGRMLDTSRHLGEVNARTNNPVASASGTGQPKRGRSSHGCHVGGLVDL